MGKVIPFPFNKSIRQAPLARAPLAPSQQDLLDMDDGLRALLIALQNGRITPEKMFIVFAEADTYCYLNWKFSPGQLGRAVTLVAKDIARGDNEV